MRRTCLAQTSERLNEAGWWVGILLDQIADDALESHLREARRIIASKRKPARKPHRA